MSGNNQEGGLVDPNLQKDSAALTLGYGSGGMDPILFTVPRGQDVDVSFFKIFATTHAVDIGSISQSSPFTPKFTEAKKRGVECKPFPAPKHWTSRTIPVVSRRTQIV